MGKRARKGSECESQSTVQLLDEPSAASAADDDMGAALVAARFPASEGWRNANVCGHNWRCNRWERAGLNCWDIAESHFVKATPDGLVVL